MSEEMSYARNQFVNCVAVAGAARELPADGGEIRRVQFIDCAGKCSGDGTAELNSSADLE
jgi:hypothetical protein